MEGAELGDNPPLFLELIEDLQKKALFCDIDVLYFWELTIAEVKLVINTFYEKEKMKAQEQAIFSYNQAYLTALGGGLFHPMSNSKKSLPSIEEVYPELFDDDLKKDREKEKQKAKLRKEKAFLLMFAEQHNEQRKSQRKGGDE